MIETVTFGDLALSDFGFVVDIRRTPAGIELSTDAVSGRDGDVLKGVRLTQPEVSCMLVSHAVGVHGRRMLVRALSPMLLKREYQTLRFSSDDGLSYRAILSERPDFDEYISAGTMRLEFLVDGPFMSGRTVTKAMTGTTPIRVEGSYPTPLKVSGTATPSDGHFGVRLDNADYMRVALSATGTVTMDSGARTCKVGGVTRQITLDSDWLVMEPGDHTLTFSPGSGTIELEWTERWL